MQLWPKEKKEPKLDGKIIRIITRAVVIIRDTTRVNNLSNLSSIGRQNLPDRLPDDRRSISNI
jgi:hypothetical protein